VGARPAPESGGARTSGGKRDAAHTPRGNPLPPLNLDALAESWRVRLQRLRDATDQTREPLALLGYEAAELDRFVLASRQPAAIAGAAEIVTAFDRHSQAKPLSVTAGGGRGIELVPRSLTGERQAELAREFAQRTHGAVLVTACVPYERPQEAECLRWLALALADAADTAQRPAWSPALSAAERCADCETQAAPPGSANRAPICERCAACSREGQKTADGHWEIPDLAEAGSVTAIAAGRGLRGLLASLESLEAVSGISALVFAVLEQAQREAEQSLLIRKGGGPGSGRRRIVAPATGGAEVLAIVSPSQALRYVGDLVRSVQSLSSEAVRIAGGFPESAASRISRMGLSVGLVVSDPHTPALGMLARARAAESLASHACASRGWRSAVHIERFTAGNAWSGPDTEWTAGELPHDSRPYSLEATSWQSWLRRATALRRIPAAQRAQGQARIGSYQASADAEFWNQFRYQVARSPEWKRYYRTCGADWREALSLHSARPDRGLQILAELVP
jgi:hypothetical protein